MSFLSMCIHSSSKDRKHSHHSRRGPAGSVAPILSLVPTNISPNVEDSTSSNTGRTKQHSPALEQVAEEQCFKHARNSRPFTELPRHNHSNCENDSQKSATCSSTSNESHSTEHTSGYQTDDGTFEGKMLRLATRNKPANIRMTAVKDYKPCCDEELLLRKGQRVKVLYKNNDWVYAVTKTGEAGYVPYNFVRPSRKYSGYQSEPEYVADTDFYQSGYETDMPGSGRKRYGGGGARTQVGDFVPAYSVHTGFRENCENHSVHHGHPQHHHYHQQHHHQQQQQQHRSIRLGSGGSGGSPVAGPPRAIPRCYTSGYTSAVEYPSTPDSRRHPRPAKSLHNIADVSELSSPNTTTDRRPLESKPRVDTFSQELLEELVVIHDFEAQEEDEVLISKGERVKVLNADDPFWLWVETQSGMQGFVPRSCCSLGNHPCLQSNSTRRALSNSRAAGASTGASTGATSRNARRYYYQRSKNQMVARQARTQAKQRFHELARQRNNAQNPILMDKEEIQRVGSKLIVLMDYMACKDDEISIQFAETVYADVLKQAGAERIWAYCPRTELCGFIPVSLVVPPVV